MSSVAPKKFLNDPSDVVSDLKSDFLIQDPNTIRKQGAKHNVTLSSNVSYDKVDILSGGGSGHELSHASHLMVSK